MSNIILPEIVAVGIFSAQYAVKNTEITKPRKTTMFEIELPIGEGGISFIDRDSSPINENTVICAKPGQSRRTRLPFKCFYIHMIVTEGDLYERLIKMPSYIKISDRERYERIFSELCGYYDSALYQDILLMQSRVLELIHLLYEYTQNMEFNGKPNNKKMIEDVIHYIKNNLSTDLSLETVSRYASFSPIHFHNCFKRSTGKTLREFVEEQRIQKAIHLLTSTDLTLSDIAYECGFSSQSYFSFAFKQKMKLPPREYAKRIQLRYENR